MATNRERQVGHMTGFPPAVYPFAFSSMRGHSPFDLLANSSLFGRFGADLPKEMAALCEYRPGSPRGPTAASNRPVLMEPKHT